MSSRSEKDPLILQSGGVEVELRDVSQQPTSDHQAVNTWFSSSSIIVANMLGAGVLGLPAALRDMGWMGGVIVLIFITLYSIYGGLILGWLRGDDDSIRTYGALADKITSKYGPFSAKFWKYFCATIGYIYVFGSCTIYLTTCKISGMQILQKCGNTTNLNPDCSSSGCNPHGVVDLSETVWLVIVCLLLIPLAQIRSLAHAGFVSYLGVGTIAVVNVVVIAHTIYDLVHDAVPPSHNFNRSFQDFVNGLTQLTFAYGGHVIMVDIISVMKTPSDWPKSVWSSQLFMFSNYAIIGCLGYAVYGDGVPAPITLTLPNTWIGIVTNVCLFIHVAVAYCINSTVLTTACVNAIWPSVLSSGSTSAKMIRWFVCSVGVMLISFLIGILVPFFSNLMNVYSSLGIMSLSFAVPVTFLIMNERKKMTTATFIVNSLLVLIATTACAMGVWAAGSDIAHNWKECHYKI